MRTRTLFRITFYLIQLNFLFIYNVYGINSDSLNPQAIEKTINDALENYIRSKSETDDPKLAEEYLQIAYNQIKIAEILLENDLLDIEIDNLKSELISLQTENLRLQDKIKQNIALFKSKRDKNIIADELYYKNSFDKLEEALTTINIAEDADSTIYSSEIMNNAVENYQLAKKYFDEGSYEKSTIYSEKAIELANTAHDTAKSKNQLREQLNNDLKNIFGFDTRSVDNTVMITSKELFLPLSSTIRFDLYPSLDKIAEILGKYKDISLQIESYDLSKSDKTKLVLSNEQSNTIKTYLVSKGLRNEININMKQTIGKEYIKRGVNIILSVL